MQQRRGGRSMKVIEVVAVATSLRACDASPVLPGSEPTQPSASIPGLQQRPANFFCIDLPALTRVDSDDSARTARYLRYVHHRGKNQPRKGETPAAMEISEGMPTTTTSFSTKATMK
jgi:hypothetical protein